MFLVLQPEASGTIECFAGPHHAQGKRAAAMPQPSLGRSVVDMCRPVFVAGVPQKLLVRAIVSCHGIVKGKNGARRQMFLFFPMRHSRADDQVAPESRPMTSFSCPAAWDQEQALHPSIVSVEAYRAAVHTWPERAAALIRRSNRQHPGAAGSVPDPVSVHPDFHRYPDQVGMVLRP